MIAILKRVRNGGKCVVYVLMLAMLMLLISHMKTITNKSHGPSLTNGKDILQETMQQHGLETHENYQVYEEMFHSALTNVTYDCKRIAVWGGYPAKIAAGDGAKRICLDENIKPTPSDCIVYSFGINEEWSFDTAAANYGCEIYSFDPSLKRKTSMYKDHIHFYQIGISNETKTKVIHPHGRTWSMMSFKDIATMLGHQDKYIDVVKMDVEWAEWVALPQMLMDGSFNKVKQLMVEFHYHKQPVSHYVTIEALRRYGLELFDHSPRNRCNMPNKIYACYEASYVNTLFV